MVYKISKVIHFDKAKIELVQTGLSYTACFYTDTTPVFYMKFDSDGISIVDDFITELINYKESTVVKDFLNMNSDILRTFKLKKSLFN